MSAACTRAERDAPPPSPTSDVRTPGPSPTVTPLPVTHPGGVVVHTEHDGAYDGGYDGTSAIFLDDGTGGTHVALARDCPGFGCDSLDVFAHPTDAMSHACADGTLLVLDFARDPRAGHHRSVDAALAIRDYEGTSGIAAATDVRLLTVGPASISGRLDLTAPDRRVRGTFTAKICPNTP
jgi:hypothetical protein